MYSCLQIPTLEKWHQAATVDQNLHMCAIWIYKDQGLKFEHPIADVSNQTSEALHNHTKTKKCLGCVLPPKGSV